MPRQLAEEIEVGDLICHYLLPRYQGVVERIVGGEFFFKYQGRDLALSPGNIKILKKHTELEQPDGEDWI